MEARELHNWNVTPTEARDIQQQLATMISKKNKIDSVRLIAGVDISAPDRNKKAHAAAVVLSYPELDLVETRTIEKEVVYPYVPGLLSFREAPLILEVCSELESRVDEGAKRRFSTHCTQ